MALREAVDSLVEPLRQLVDMHYFQGLKYQEIARILKTPVGAVKSRLYDARQKLREILTKEEIETKETETRKTQYKSAA